MKFRKPETTTVALEDEDITEEVPRSRGEEEIYLEGEFGANNIPIAIPLFSDEIFQKIPKDQPSEFGDKIEDNIIRDFDDVPEYEYDYNNDEALIANYDIPKVVEDTTSVKFVFQEDTTVGNIIKTLDINREEPEAEEITTEKINKFVPTLVKVTKEVITKSEQETTETPDENTSKTAPSKSSISEVTNEDKAFVAKSEPSTEEPSENTNDKKKSEVTVITVVSEVTVLESIVTTESSQQPESTTQEIPSVFKFLPTLSTNRRDTPTPSTSSAVDTTTKHTKVEIEEATTTKTDKVTPSTTEQSITDQPSTKESTSEETSVQSTTQSPTLKTVIITEPPEIVPVVTKSVQQESPKVDVSSTTLSPVIVTGSSTGSSSKFPNFPPSTAGLEEELRQAISAGLNNLGSFVLWSDSPRVVQEPTRPSPVFTPQKWRKYN